MDRTQLIQQGIWLPVFLERNYSEFTTRRLEASGRLLALADRDPEGRWLAEREWKEASLGLHQALRKTMKAGTHVAYGQQAGSSLYKAVPKDLWPRLVLYPTNNMPHAVCHGRIHRLMDGYIDLVADPTTDAYHDVHVVPVPPRKPRGPKPDPIWQRINPEVLARLDEEGEPDTLAEVERMIADQLAQRGEERADSTVREHAKKLLDTFREKRATGQPIDS